MVNNYLGTVPQNRHHRQEIRENPSTSRLYWRRKKAIIHRVALCVDTNRVDDYPFTVDLAYKYTDQGGGGGGLICCLP